MFHRKPEKMHSIKNDKPDWEGIPDDKLNRWQRVAKKTGGWITAANGLTIMGFCIFVNGITDYANGQYAEGTAKVMAARGLDLTDGIVADKHGVKGPVGKRLDVGVDMAELFITAPVLVATDTLPIVPAIAIGAPKVAGTIGSIAAEMRGRDNNVDESGKSGTFIIWGSVGSFMVAKALGGVGPDLVSDAFEALGWAGAFSGGAMATKASVEYIHAGFGPRPDRAA